MQIVLQAEGSLVITTTRYDLGGGPIRSLVLRNQDRSLTVVSPPMRCTESDFGEIENLGTVKILIAPNKFHFMGIPLWKKRFPHAKIYTSAVALPRLENKTGLKFLVIEQIEKQSDTHFLSCPGTRNGEVLIVRKEKFGWFWFVTDLFFNYVELPPKWFPRVMVEKISGTGVVINPFCRFLFIRDKVELRKWLIEQLEQFPPQTVVFSHGEPIQSAELLDRFKDRVHRY